MDECDMLVMQRVDISPSQPHEEVGEVTGSSIQPCRPLDCCPGFLNAKSI